MAKERLDVLLVRQGLVESREKARALIMAGNVYINNQKADKAGTMVKEDAVIRVDGGMKYVSRGGLKLEGALQAFGIDVGGMRAADIGASTGGFTELALKRGAKKVIASILALSLCAYSAVAENRVKDQDSTAILLNEVVISAGVSKKQTSPLRLKTVSSNEIAPVSTFFT